MSESRKWTDNDPNPLSVSHHERKHMHLKALLPLAFAISAVAQPAPKTEATPQFSTIEIAGLTSILDKKKQAEESLNNINKALAAAEADVAKNHPGYKFSEQTNSLVADPKPAPAKK